MKEDRTLNACLYYKGEKKNPYPQTDMSSTYWQLEYMWMNEVDPEEDDPDYIVQLIYDYPDCFHYLEPPTSLIAFMYDQYRQVGYSKNGFDNWIQNYLNSHT